MSRSSYSQTFSTTRKGSSLSAKFASIDPGRKVSIPRSTYENGSPFSLFIATELKKLKPSHEDLNKLFYSIQCIGKLISAQLRCAGLAQPERRVSCIHVPNSSNPATSSIEHFSNNQFVTYLLESGVVSLLVSRKTQKPIQANEEKQGKYIVCFDPLEGGTLNYNGTAGSIFSVYKVRKENHPKQEDMLQPGKDLLAAGYFLYGSSTVLVVTLGLGVYCFTLDPSTGEFLLTGNDIRVPTRGNTYAVEEGYMYQWDSSVAAYIEDKKSYKIGKPYHSQYTGSITTDVYRTLKEGGICLYPSIAAFSSGKYFLVMSPQTSLMFHCIPLAFIIHHAGGLASDGRVPILDIPPQSLLQTSPLYIGSRDDVRDLLAFFRKEARTLTRGSSSLSPRRETSSYSA